MRALDALGVIGSKVVGDLVVRDEAAAEVVEAPVHSRFRGAGPRAGDPPLAQQIHDPLGPHALARSRPTAQQKEEGHLLEWLVLRKGAIPAVALAA